MDYCRACGENVRRLHRGRGITPVTSAHLAGVRPSYLSAVERGTRNIALRNIVALAGALGMPVAELFQGIEPPPAADE